jgi:chaperonin 10 Kd subunit
VLISRYYETQNVSAIANVIVSLVCKTLAYKISISLKKEVATVSIKLTPLEDKIIVKQAQAETQTASGLYIPDNAKEKPQQGEVLAVGPGRRDDKGERIPMDVKVGDKVLYSKYGGTEVHYDGEDYLIVSSRDVLAILG